MTPARIHLSRAKGFNLQAASLALNGLAAVNVDRSTKFGNPFAVHNDDAASAVENFRDLFARKPTRLRHIILSIASGKQVGEGYVLHMKMNMDTLRGKNLACWCKLGTPCHADVLLEIANRPVCEEVRP